MMQKKMKEKTFLATTDPRVSAREIANREKAGEAAEEGIVLLKNENHVLPLKKGMKIAMYGRGVRKTVKGGTGSGSVNEREIVTIYDGLKNAGFEITTEAWLDAYDCAYQQANEHWQAEIREKSKIMWSFDAYSHTPFVAPVGPIPEKTDTDTAIFVLSRIAGENADRRAVPGDYFFSDGEWDLLREICALYQKVILVINAGGQVDLSVVKAFPNIDGIIILGMPGMAGGTAFARILSGETTPSGKLVDTWAHRYEDFPNAKSFSHNDDNTYMEYYKEGIYVGYRYFDTFDVPAQYGFGFGRSYTTFEIVRKMVTLSGDTVTVKAIATNTGDTFSGKEVVQVYATCPCGRLAKEYRRLVGFAKTNTLKPGQAEEVEITFPIQRLNAYDPQIPGWILEAGSYYIWVGSSLEDSKIVAQLQLGSEVLLEKTHNECFRLADMKEMQPNTEKDLQKRESCALYCANHGIPALTIPEAQFQTRIVEYRSNRELVDQEAMDFVNSLSTEQLLRLANGELRKDGTRTTIAGEPKAPGACGETSRCAEDRNLPSILMADGPAGLRLTQTYREKGGEKLPSNSRPAYSEGKMVVTADTLPPVEGEVVHYQYCTAIPTGTQIAQSWNVGIARELGQMVAGEMEEFGITVWLAPGMNIHRNPLCGRNFEYFSEDPVLTGKMAGAVVAGVQSVPGCMTMVKHFACNNQEDNRHFSNSIVSERPLREIYLKGFEIAIKEYKPMSIMSSYNFLNGVHAANNYMLCTNILRNEWGFDGFVATDWRTTVHDGSCTASGCMRAGNDLNMPGFELDVRNLKKELADGTLSIEDVKACVSRLVSMIWRSNQY